ncbi:LPS O-antigen length regulator [Alishewanella longhuensis]
MNQVVSLTQFLKLIWQYKIYVILIPLVVSVAVFVGLKQLPDIYRSEVLLAPAESANSTFNLGQLGSIAALSGINVNNQGRYQARLAIEVLASRGFLIEFIEKHDLVPLISASKNWDPETNQIIFDAELFDTATNTWLNDVKTSESLQPSTLEVYESFRKALFVNRNTDSGLVTISYEHHSPIVAQNILGLLVNELNNFMKQRDIDLANHSLTYLKNQLEQNQVEEVRRAIFQLIEEQTKTLMLANVKPEYIFEVIDPAYLAEKPHSPRRLLLTILALLLTGFMTVFVILLRWVSAKANEAELESE